MVEPHLKVFKNRTELVSADGRSTTYHEGAPNDESKIRNSKLRKALEEGWFEDFITVTISDPSTAIVLKDVHLSLCEDLVSTITSEVGRAVVGLTVLQLVVKAILPQQSIRLHKGGHAEFSWCDGITMRTFDANFIQPTLRKFGLLYVNKYGVFMTRSLAENYPYTQFYKAAIRGGKEHWLKLVEEIEENRLDSVTGLRCVISLLRNRSNVFEKLAKKALSLTKQYLKVIRRPEAIFEFISLHVEQSAYSARLFEIALHSLLQTFQDAKTLHGYLLPLCQMRTANKKHRNIGDIEIVQSQDNKRVIEAWDAKYGKPYLRDELEELNDKLDSYGQVSSVGYVTNVKPDLSKDISARIEELNELHDVKVRIMSFKDWYEVMLSRIDAGDELIHAKAWLSTYVDYLCQRRRDVAPIDEPSDDWVQNIVKQLI